MTFSGGREFLGGLGAGTGGPDPVLGGEPGAWAHARHLAFVL